jgi:hypothetical protein
MPNRPRSLASRASSGFFSPSVIALSSSLSDMPRPLSRIAMRLSNPAHVKSTRTSVAPAETLLSTMSAIAAAVE